MKRIGLLCLAMVLALGTLGVGYALWWDEVTIEGTVDTGTVRIGIPHAYVSRLEQDKNVATVELGWEGPILEKEFPGLGVRTAYEKLVVTIDNAFPCLLVDIAFYVGSVGSIPLHITGIQISDPSGQLIFVQTSWPGATPLEGYFYHVDDPDQLPIIEVTIINLVGTQMHWCGVDKADLILHFEQPAKQNHEYTFEVKVIAEQWAK
ncbi:MAG: hypothetical protein KAU10_06170 [Dehalococcoidia bacterium]|nr:hypothetical protein [Dehalococcoidia bacterium]